MPSNKSFVETIKERCRVCYTCVRECPAKAIRISDGQAEIIGERCINCGNCVRVCSQRAKQVISSIPDIRALLDSGAETAVCLAPSFPAEFTDLRPERLVGMLRRLGFGKVAEVAAGADLVADAYRKLLAKNDGARYIATTCPAVVTYVERYHPQLVGHLAPIVSPMIATARCLRALYGPQLKVVFIGPCVAKKQESRTVQVGSEMDGVLTFVELRQMFAESGITAEAVEPGEFDGPRAGSGALFSISRGLLQAAAIGEDLIAGQVIAADGRVNFAEAIKEFEGGTMHARLLETLCCTGCIMGAGMSTPLPLFARRARVSEYVRTRRLPEDDGLGRAIPNELEGLDLSRGFAPNDQRIPLPSPEELTGILARMGKLKPEDELNCGACGYDTCREHATAIHRGLAESEMCLPYTIDQLRKTVKELGVSNDQITKAQEKRRALFQFVSILEHELKSPICAIEGYLRVLKDPQTRPDPAAHDHMLERCLLRAEQMRVMILDLLDLTRIESGLKKRELVELDLVEIARSALEIVAAEAKVRNIALELHAAAPLQFAADRLEMEMLLNNLVSNAVKYNRDGGRVDVTLSAAAGKITISVADTGIGLTPEEAARLFTDFARIRKDQTRHILGSGLGLSIVRKLAELYHGQASVASTPGVGSTFTVELETGIRA